MERGKEFTFADRKPIQQGFIPSEWQNDDDGSSRLGETNN
jgi:hypothetical protein